MSLIAVRTSDGAEIEAFSVEPSEWEVMRAAQRGEFVMIGTDWPAVLKRSIRLAKIFEY
jgi:hypothetical protein